MMFLGFRAGCRNMVGTVRHLHTALMHMYCYAYKHDQRNKEHILPDKLGRLYRENFKIGDWRKHAESSSISSQRSSFPTSFWTSSYQPPPPPCLSGVHPDFPVTAPGTFPTPDPSSWPGHGLHQTAQPPPPATSESWHYPLASQVSPSYAHMHDVYMHRHHPHPHMHHHHPSSHRDPRYGSLLMPSVRAARIPAPQCDVTKTDPAAVTSATSAWAGAFHGTVDIVPSFGFDTGLQHQDKSKEASWF
nr:transcription cofactor vestigial-like protein 3 isoform X2 [Columba livia]